MLNQRLQDQLAPADLTFTINSTLCDVFLSALNTAEQNAINKFILPQADKFQQIVNSELKVAENDYLGSGEISRLSGLEVTAIKSLLKALELNSKLRKDVFRQFNIGHGEQDSFVDSTPILINLLQKAGLLPAIQYLICDALLTGGKGCAEDLHDNDEAKQSNLAISLDQLFQGMGCRWDDFFDYSYPRTLLRKTILVMAMELDNPTLLLTVLREPIFTLELVTQKNIDIYISTIDAYAKENNLINIQHRIGEDLRSAPLAINIQSPNFRTALLDEHKSIQRSTTQVAFVQCDSERAKFFTGERLGCDSSFCGATAFLSTFGLCCFTDSMAKGIYESYNLKSWQPVTKTLLFAAVGGLSAYFATSLLTQSSDLSIGSTISNELGHIVAKTVATTVGAGLSAYTSRFFCVLNQRNRLRVEDQSPLLELSPLSNQP